MNLDDNGSYSFNREDFEDEEFDIQYYMNGVYKWMTIALFITAFAAKHVASTEWIMELIFGDRTIFYGLLVAELVLVIVLNKTCRSLSSSLASLGFIAYAIMNGITLSILFLVYTDASIAATFFITAFIFLSATIFGYFTNIDLGPIGTFLFMCLCGLLLSGIYNIFFYNSLFYDITSYIGVLVFTAYTAYDTQKIRQMVYEVKDDEYWDENNLSIIGALVLYLDFVNLFLYLLRLFGKRK